MIFIFLCTFTDVFGQETYFQESQYHREVGAALDSGNYSQSLESLNRHLAKNPYDHYAYKLRAMARKYFADFQEGAITDLNIYLEYFPDDRDALFDRGTLRHKTGKYNLALKDFLQLLNTNNYLSTTAVYFQIPQNVNEPTRIFTVQGGVKPLYYSYIASSYYHLDQPDSALIYYDSALQSDPQNSGYMLGRAMTLEKAGNVEYAISTYEQALMKDPDNNLAKSSLGKLLNTLGRTEEAQQYLMESIEYEPELAYPYAERGFTYLQTGRYSQALEDYNKALAIAPENVEYLLNRGKAYLKVLLLDEAAKDFQKAMRLKPENEQAYFNMAIVRYRQGKFREAVELLDIALFYYPDYGFAYYNRAIAYSELNDYEQACRDIKKAAALGLDVPPRMTAAFCD